MCASRFRAGTQQVIGMTKLDTRTYWVSGPALRVAITLPGRYIEFEVPAVVAWFDGPEIGLEMPYLTARQAYGVALAIDLIDVTDSQAVYARSRR